MLAVAALALTACGNSGDAGGSGSSDGKSLNIYTSVNETTMKELAKAFEAKEGIKATYTRLVTGPVVARYTAEATNGTPGADVVILGNEPFFADGLSKGWFRDVTPATVPNAKDLAPEYQFKGSLGVGLQRLDGVVVNTDKVKPEDAPKTWNDLLDPKWKGKIVANDPRAIPIIMAQYQELGKKLGDQFLAGLGKQDIQWSASGLAGVQAVAAGERDVMIGANDGFIIPLLATAPNAPISKLAILSDAHLGYAWNAGVSAKSANSENGMKFLDWLRRRKASRSSTGRARRRRAAGRHHRRSVRAGAGLRGALRDRDARGPEARAHPSRAVVTESVADTEPAIRIRGLSNTYGRRPGSDGERALKSVDLDVREGEFLVLLGPSGCGKTTLLRCIAGPGAARPREVDRSAANASSTGRGSARAAERAPVEHDVPVVRALAAHDGDKNVAFPLQVRGSVAAEVRERVEARCSTRWDRRSSATRYPGQMSGGQQQRLALARALVGGPQVVLFDEPLSNVDAKVRDKLRVELLSHAAQLGFTAIYVTHDQTEAMELADRIAVMSQGRIAQLDAPKAMYASPQNLHVARFLGQSNEVEFVVKEYDAQRRRVTGVASIGPVVADWHGRTDEPAPEPEQTWVAFGRPLDFTLSRGPAGASGAPNRWTGTVEAVRFVGLYTETVVRVGEARFRCWSMPQTAGSAPDAVEADASDGEEVVVTATGLRAMREA